jgi:hypothetical protein
MLLFSETTFINFNNPLLYIASPPEIFSTTLYPPKTKTSLFFSADPGIIIHYLKSEKSA